jgi:hypothetical protein
MKLCEHADFEQAILQAAEHFRDRNLRPAIIEKDYYVTEALRLVAAFKTTDALADPIIFKGGTSLAKGWNSSSASQKISISSSTPLLTGGPSARTPLTGS